MASTILHGFLVSLLLLSLRTACGQCAPRDIFIGQTSWIDSQGQTRYTVVIANVGKVAVTDVHVSCQGFLPKALILKRLGIFQLLSPGDCLVDEGNKLNPGDSVTFDYVNDSKFELYPTEVKC